MYHKISADGQTDMLTVPVRDLEWQLHHLRQEGYRTISLSQLVNHLRQGTPLPEKPLLITFDDGYLDNFTNAYPVFRQLGMKANIFLVPSFIDTDTYLGVNDLKAMDPSLIEFGLHSFDHVNYRDLSKDAVLADLDKCKKGLTEKGIAFQPCLAFPFGAWPKKGAASQAFFDALAEQKLSAAFRIGNRLNRLPLKEPLLIERLDIRGGITQKKFTRLVRKGKSLF
ncbi:polysaccharide deacetylase family protein [Paraflavitalea sp. CAU 1676]|uniref:polysaccharide deacetylase family protein n=1 Tax=Paraflavitalea sp. CAU 1676 TaxID=3032598 RepID=UPI0023DC75C2|nr:polysaccharide deacetylase family protein [Paraflavitalea sp. CAU 1676]MDF2189623.1 polysaccharide deacetylase family protein [Paraflavitalea sp. CAU 1676]